MPGEIEDLAKQMLSNPARVAVTPVASTVERIAQRVVHVAKADKPALLGSVKTNFGHLESGAGAASLAKVLMSFQHNVIPPRRLSHQMV